MNTTMRTLKRTFILGILITAIPMGLLWAQGHEEKDPLLSLKARIAGLLEENKKLELEYANLKSEFFKRQQNPVQENGKLQKFGNQPPAKNQIQEQKENEAKKELLELQNQKKALEQEIKFKAFLAQDREKRKQWITDGLKKQLQKNLERQKELTRLIEEAKEKPRTYPQRTKEFKKEIELLGVQMEEMEKKLESAKQENAQLKRSRSYAQTARQNSLAPQEQEKEQLTQEIEKLEERINGLDEESDQQGLLEEISRLTQENEQLRNEIAQKKKEKDSGQ